MSADPPEQIIMNVGGNRAANNGRSDRAMEEAMDAAVAATVNNMPEGITADAATIAAARERAQQMVSGEDAEGLKHMQNLALSMGLPATRALFHHMITASRKKGAVKADAMAKVTEFSPVTEVGCMKLDFLNTQTGQPDTAYIRLDQCPRTHNLDVQLDKLRSIVPEQKWTEALKPMGLLIRIGRTTYGQATRKNLPLIRTLFDLPDNDLCTMYLDLNVDITNTTLYINDSWPNRVGIFVSLESEIQAEKAAKSTKTK